MQIFYMYNIFQSTSVRQQNILFACYKIFTQWFWRTKITLSHYIGKKCDKSSDLGHPIILCLDSSNLSRIEVEKKYSVRSFSYQFQLRQKSISLCMFLKRLQENSKEVEMETIMMHWIFIFSILGRRGENEENIVRELPK